MIANEKDIEMQREAAPVTVAGIKLQPLTIPRVNAAGAMRCAVFNLDETQRADLLESRTYRGIIRDIIVIFWLCANDESAAHLALWNPTEAVVKASIWAAERNISEASKDYPDFQVALWALMNPLFLNDANQEAAPADKNELGAPSKKKPRG